jgi:energy-coupling factor transport system permease protein
MPLTLYRPTGGRAHRLHPVTKCLALVGFVIAAFLVDRPVWLLPLGALALAGLVAVGGGETLRRFRVMFVLLFVFTTVTWTFFNTRPWGPSVAGFVFGIATGLRLGTFLVGGLLFLTVTRIEEIAYALGRLGVPYTVGFTLTLAFRLVPVFFDAAFSIVDAQRCRGFDASRGHVLARLRGYVPIIVPVFIGALRRADRMAMALELRGFNSGRPRTTWVRARAGRADAIVAVGGLVLVGLYVAVWWSGSGALPHS